MAKPFSHRPVEPEIEYMRYVANVVLNSKEKRILNKIR